MTVGKLIAIYAGWLRSKPLREALAMLGVAVGVALVFATITANLSISTSANRIVHSLAGTAELQASARTPDGVRAHMVTAPGILATADALEVPVAIERAGRRVSTQIIGAGAAVIALNPTIGNLPPTEGLVLPSSLASTLRVAKSDSVVVTARGRTVRETVGNVLGTETIGALADSRLAFGSLGYVQRLVGLPGRISTILVKTQSGKTQLAERELRRLVEPSMEVTNTTIDRELLDQALKPQNQSTLFFALLGGLVGVLLIVTTTMLSLADRRDELAGYRLMGFTPRQLIQIVVSQGVILGAVGSLIGVVGGWWLAVDVFRSNPEYLASAFPLGTGTIISLPLIVGVWFTGMTVSCACVGCALVGNGTPVVRISGRARHRLVLGVVILLVASLALVTTLPLLAALLLTLALFASMPAWVDAVTRIAGAFQQRWLVGAAGAIRSSQTMSIGLAATAAMGVFGAVVAQGAHSNLLHGLETGYAHYVDSADVWVASPGDSLATNSFPAAVSRLKTVPGVKTARPYYGGWIDMAGRRVWLISRSSSTILPAGEITQGGQLAEQRLHAGGWIALSDQLARALDVHIGSTVTVPTPSGPKQYRLAATTTNLGWSSGVLFLPASDYVRYWPGAEPTAIEIDGHPDLTVLQRIVGPGLTVQTSKQRAAIADVLPRQGLERLSQIAWLLIISATLAVALALSASLWQRRSELASHRLQSFTPSQIQIMLACEALLVVGSGAILGALAGVYGHFAADRYLHDSTGYPIIWSASPLPVIGIVLLVAAATVLILAVPGRIAARSPLRLAFDGR